MLCYKIVQRYFFFFNERPVFALLFQFPHKQYVIRIYQLAFGQFTLIIRSQFAVVYHADLAA
jgi:hypothetical protein